MNINKGYYDLPLSDNELADFYEGKLNPLDYINIKENQYCIIFHHGVPIDDGLYKVHNQRLIKVGYEQIYNHFTENHIKPLDIYQRAAIDMLKSDAPVKILRGVYGSGKDHLMLNYALAEIEENTYEKIIYIRPNVTVANVPDIGALPGGVEEKLGWLYGCFYDKVGGVEGVERLKEDGRLEMMPLPFIRGCSFNNSIIYVSEGQNMTVEVIKLILSRVGENSILLINGDSHQTDKRIFDKDNGLTFMVDKLAGNKLFATVYLPISHRSEVASLCDLLEE